MKKAKVRNDALKHEWIRVDDRLPEAYEDVIVMYVYKGRVQVDISSYGGCGKWCFGYSEILAWMPIPSFDEILKANADVLKRLKDK